MNQNNDNVKYLPQLRGITILALLAVVFFTAPHFISVLTNDKKNNTIPHTINTGIDKFKYISLEAQSAYVYDITTEKILYSKNKNAQLPLASVTKIMTALVATELASVNQSIRISADSLKPEGDSGLLVGDLWKIKDIIDLTLISSSNDGARALASVASLDTNTKEITFVEYMNRRASKLGMAQTFFLNEHGLDESETFAGAYGSAEDVGKLLTYVYTYHYNLMEATTQEELGVSSKTTTYDVKNTNATTNDISGLTASKTGFTDLAGGNLAVIFEAGPLRPLAVVVLGSTIDGRFEDVLQLTRAAIETLSK